MTCYLRHMKDLLEQAGIRITEQNRKDVDRAIHRIVEVDYKNCPETWREAKKRISGNPREKSKFISALKKALDRPSGRPLNPR